MPTASGRETNGEMLERMLDIRFQALSQQIQFGDNTVGQKVEFIKENLEDLSEQIQKVVLDNHENRLRGLEINGSPETSRRVIDFENRLRILEERPEISKDTEDRIRIVEQWKNALPAALFISLISIVATVLGVVIKLHG